MAKFADIEGMVSRFILNLNDKEIAVLKTSIRYDILTTVGRMSLFDNLPRDIRDEANEHGEMGIIEFLAEHPRLLDEMTKGA